MTRLQSTVCGNVFCTLSKTRFFQKLVHFRLFLEKLASKNRLKHVYFVVDVSNPNYQCLFYHTIDMAPKI